MFPQEAAFYRDLTTTTKHCLGLAFHNKVTKKHKTYPNLNNKNKI